MKIIRKISLGTLLSLIFFNLLVAGTNNEIEYVPGVTTYSKKIAIIVNGSDADRHLENTQLALEVLSRKGFDEILLAQDENYKSFESGKTKIHQYKGTKKGLDKVFKDIQSFLQKDALVLFNATGHGDCDEGGSVSLDEPIGRQEIINYFKTFKDKQVKVLAIFDGCKTAILTKDIIEKAGVQGVAYSPVKEDELTSGRVFPDTFWQKLDKGSDLDGDGRRTAKEYLHVAKDTYCKTEGVETKGTYCQSEIELTKDNFDIFMRSKYPVIIDVSATWCGFCKKMKKEWPKVIRDMEGKVEVVTLTTDTNPDSDSLLKKLKVKPAGLPTIIIQNGIKREILAGYTPADQIVSLLGGTSQQMSKRERESPIEDEEPEERIVKPAAVSVEEKFAQAYQSMHGISKEDYIKLCKDSVDRLIAAGIIPPKEIDEIIRHQNYIRNLTVDKMQNKNYVTGLIELETSGIILSVFELPLTKGSDLEYISVLKTLNQNQIKVHGELISNLPPEKAKNQNYISFSAHLK